MMKLWLPTGPLPNHTNPNRLIPSNTLYARHLNCFFISRTYLSRRKLQLSHPIPTRKWSLHILHLPLRPHRTWPILQFLYIPRNMKYQRTSTTNSYSHRIRRLYPTLRTDIILRRNCYH
uniref:Uncharacterized protein n=1 Tax=Monodon monoceros TaxID=40151 RepID=A0A8C6AHV9_MONMO